MANEDGTNSHETSSHTQWYRFEHTKKGQISKPIKASKTKYQTKATNKKNTNTGPEPFILSKSHIISKCISYRETFNDIPTGKTHANNNLIPTPLQIA